VKLGLVLVLVPHCRHTPSHCHLVDLTSLPFIQFPKSSRMEEPIDRYFAANGLQPPIIMRFDRAESI
jgi:DNA-binding transcriptional LysR family regulator